MLTLTSNHRAVWHTFDELHHMIIFAATNELEELLIKEFIKNSEGFESYAFAFKSVDGAYSFYAPTKTHIGGIVDQLPPDLRDCERPNETMNGQKFRVFHNQEAFGFVLIPVG